MHSVRRGETPKEVMVVIATPTDSPCGSGVMRPSEFRRNLYQALGDKAGVIWPMRTCGLVTAGECGSRLNAVRNVDEKKESGNRQSHGPGPMSNKELDAKRHEGALDSTVRERTREFRVRLR